MKTRRRGRHQSTDKSGKRTLARLAAIAGVGGIVIGRSIGGKAIGRRSAAGDFKLQGEVAGGYKGIMQTSKGVQEIFIRITGSKTDVARRIKDEFSA